MNWYQLKWMHLCKEEISNKIFGQFTYALNSEVQREPLTEGYLAWKNSVGFRCKRTWKDHPENNIDEEFSQENT